MTLPPPSASELERLWSELSTQHGPGAPGRLVRRVIAGTRHDCFVAVDFPTRRRMLSIVANDAAPPSGPEHRQISSGVLLVHGSSPSSGRPSIDLVLQDDAHSDIFTALVADLLNVLSGAGANEPAGDLLMNRIEEWRRMLVAVAPTGLSRERQQGLFGEMVVLEDLLLPALGAHAVMAWTGPDNQLQDFQFPLAAIEVKTVSGTNAHVVRITNERQLDNHSTGRLFLVSLALDSRTSGPGHSLPELVHTLRRRTQGISASAEFEQRLTRAGYLETQAYMYEDRHYAIRQRLVHEVGDGFPRIIEAGLPAGLSDVSYTLDLHAAAAFRTTEQDMTEGLA